MAIKLTAESFLAVVKQSGLIEQDQLKRLLQEFKQQGVKMGDSRAIAEQLVARKSLTRWQADKILKGKHKGFFLGKYRLLSLLGKGGMSSVYLAEHVLMRRRCAIKVLPAKRVHDTSYLGRFYREAQAVAALDHPNIVRAYDVDKEVEKDTEIHFLVMEYVQGEPLQELIIRKGPLGFIDAAEYIRQGAEGLHHAHIAGMVHRDIKPGNLLIDKSGVVKILDLGLARFFNDTDEESLTVAHDEKVLGTADYLAPEQALDSHTVDERADIYSLGCTFYFLLTGHPPFTEGTLAQRLMAHQTKAPPPVEEKREGVPPGLVTIINKMMAKGLEARYQSGEETATALAEWLIDNAGEQWKLSHPSLAGIGSGVQATPTQTKQKKPASGTSKTSAHALVDTNSPGSTHDTRTKAPVPVAEPVVEAPVAKKTHEDELASFLSNLDSGVAPASAPSVPVSKPAASVVDPMQQDAVVVAPAITRRPVAKKPTSAQQQQQTNKRKAVSVPTAQPAPVVEPTEIPAATFDFWQFLRSPAGMISAIVASAVLVGLLTFGVFAIFKDNPSDNKTDNETVNKNDHRKDKTPIASGGDPRQLLGSPIFVGSLASSHFATIKDALKYVRNNYQPDGSDLNAFQIIEITSGTYRERIVIDNSDSQLSFPARVRLIAASGQSVELLPSGNAPVIKLSHGVNHFQIEGLTINATGKNVACELNGHLAGVKLSNLKINGFKQTGILGYGPAGYDTSRNQVQLHRNTFQSPSSAVGIRFRTTESSMPQYVSIQHCRFLGKLQAGVMFEGNCSHMEIRESMFMQNKIGIFFEGVHQSFKNIMIANNTFYKNTEGILFTNIPGAGTTELGFFRNLLDGTTGADFRIRTDFREGTFMLQLAQFPNKRSNMTSKPKTGSSGENEFYALGGLKGQKITYLSTDPHSANFMKVKTPRLKLSGTDAGLKPYYGAVAP